MAIIGARLLKRAGSFGFLCVHGYGFGARGWYLKHRAFPEPKVARQGLLHELIAIVEVMTEIDPPVRPNPGSPIEQYYRDGFVQEDGSGLTRLDDPVDGLAVPLRFVVQQQAGKIQCVLDPNAAGAEGAFGAVEQFLIGRVMQINGVVIGENEFDPPEGISRPGILP